MLRNLSEEIHLCHERAAEAREHAQASRDPEAKADFFKMERRWLLLARRFESGESLEDFARAMPAPTVAHPFDPHSMLQASGAAVFAKDKKSRMIVANPACLNLVGKSWSEVRGRNDVEWHTDRVQARNILSNDKLVIESEQAQIYEEPFDTPRGLRIILSSKAPLRNDEGQIVGIVGVAKDITERKQREERAELLQSELRHRVKNMLALVQAMARQGIAPGDGLNQFESRLLAYARSQDLLLESGGAITLWRLIAAHRAAFPAADQLHVAGPDVALPTDFAIQIGIALNELLTNSIKYGALGGDGRVNLLWYVETRDERRYLVVHWNEQHRRLQTKPCRQGFGHQVLTHSVPQGLNGVASFELMPGEVRWTLRAELRT